ncbi:hypothetical protein MSAN_00894800 [Mycena sanguinolenta]|uniref:DUF6533 domain-containing protein n=1 Tax=Mycena sanguinolenta TaxID=230812 RepID=A0A8H6YWV2_9AGAR|nr:hypothetical protein MSAN_00894800 [Mycena sanguinolenta]
MDPASVALLASRLRIVNCMHVVNITIWLFDYTLTFGAEVSHMWTSKWSLSKVLFFCSRYSPAFDVPILMYYSMVPNLSFKLVLSPTACRIILGTVFGLAVAEAILILRTYALSGRRRGVLIFFTTLWALGVTSSIILLEFFLLSATYEPPVAPGVPGCNLTGGTAVFAGIPFIIVLLNDTIIMTYTVWIVLKNYRHSQNPLILALYRDGLSYYFFLFIISAANVATLLEAPMPTAQLLNTFLRVVHSVLSTRILLHLRDIEYKQSERTAAVAPRVVLSFQNGTNIEVL